VTAILNGKGAHPLDAPLSIVEKERGMFTKKQGYCRARGGQVDLHCPGIYTGPMLPAGQAEIIGRQGLSQAQDCASRGHLVRIKIPGHCDTKVAPADAVKFFTLLLKAAKKAKTQHDNDHRPLITPHGVEYTR
jgi:hypothetical protein